MCILYSISIVCTIFCHVVVILQVSTGVLIDRDHAKQALPLPSLT